MRMAMDGRTIAYGTRSGRVCTLTRPDLAWRHGRHNSISTYLPHLPIWYTSRSIYPFGTYGHP